MSLNVLKFLSLLKQVINVTRRIIKREIFRNKITLFLMLSHR